MATKPSTTQHFGTQAQRVYLTLLNRSNMYRLATPERLAQGLDGLYAGRFDIARFWEQMQARDEMIRPTDGKRKDAIGGMEWTVTLNSEGTAPENRDQALLQKQVLAKFYENLTATDVLRSDQVGGVGLLVSQMMDARAKGYAVHEWIWQPRAVQGQWTTGLFRFCPLYWFENTSGRLRLLLQDSDWYGVGIDPAGWLISVSDDYMQAVTAGWLMKLDLLRAWVRFSERFGFPIAHGKTTAAKDSDEWNNLVDAIDAINEDEAVVTNNEAEILLIEVKNTGSNLPFPMLIERIERLVAVIILGADLSTLSAGSGEGQGASLQGLEDQKRERADASFVSETLNRKVDRPVLEYHFGPGVPIFVKFQLVPAKRLDVDRELKVDETAVRLGVPIGVDDFRERYGRPAPIEGSAILVYPIPQANPAAAIGVDSPNGTDGQGAALANAKATDEQRQALVDAASKEVAAARSEDLKALVDQLEIILELDEPEQIRAALKRWLGKNTERAKRLLESPSRLAPAIEQLISTALLNGLQESPDHED